MSSKPKVYGLQEIYLEYTYKTRDLDSNTIPRYYFPKSEITDHKYSLTYKEWSDVLKVLFKNILLYLLTGKKYKLPHRMGEIFLAKIKGGGIDWIKSKKLKKAVFHKNLHTNGFRPKVIWDRKKGKCIFKNRWLWKFNLTKSAWRIISQAIENNFNIMNNLTDVTVYSTKKHS